MPRNTSNGTNTLSELKDQLEHLTQMVTRIGSQFPELVQMVTAISTKIDVVDQKTSDISTLETPTKPKPKKRTVKKTTTSTMPRKRTVKKTAASASVSDVDDGTNDEPEEKEVKQTTPVKRKIIAKTRKPRKAAVKKPKDTSPKKALNILHYFNHQWETDKSVFDTYIDASTMANIETAIDADLADKYEDGEVPAEKRETELCNAAYQYMKKNHINTLQDMKKTYNEENTKAAVDIVDVEED